MAWQATSDVNIGDYTKASDHNKVRGNVEWLQSKADVQHNFDTSTGTGYHKAITQLITDAAGATVKDLLTSEWDPASGSATIGQALRWLAKMPDSAGNQDVFGAIRHIADAVTSGAEEGRTVLTVMAAGTPTDQIELSKNLLGVTTDSVLDIASPSKRIKTVHTDTLGDSGQALAVGSSSMRVALQPSFLVTHDTTNTNQTGDGTAYTVPWNTEIKDQGGNFASNAFTAAVTAPHTFSVLLSLVGIGSAHTFGQLRLITSNRSYVKEFNPYALLPGAGLTGEGVALTFTDVDMDAVDTAYIAIAVYNGTKVVGVSASSDQRFFSGHQQI